jgi:DNA-binding transcriptional LysR family regulator
MAADSARRQERTSSASTAGWGRWLVGGDPLILGAFINFGETIVKNATLRQLKTFETVARRLSFSRAADELNLSQPAVSAQIKHLEEHAGVPLFEQLGKRIFLTPAGREMVHHTRAIIERFRVVEETLARLKSINGGSLNIGVVSTGGYFFPRLLADFNQKNLGIKLELAIENRHQLLNQLDENRIDLAVMVGAPADPRIVSETFAPHSFLIVASPSHPLAHKRDIPVCELTKERFIVREKGSDTWGVMEEGIADGFDKDSEPIEIKNTETIKQAVIAGMGISFLSAHTVDLELKTGMLVMLDVVGLPIVRDWRIVHRADKQLSPVAEAFKHFLLEEGSTRIGKLSNVGTEAALLSAIA